MIVIYIGYMIATYLGRQEYAERKIEKEMTEDQNLSFLFFELLIMLPVNVCLEAFNFTVPPYVH